jgi:hypothetical protein
VADIALVDIGPFDLDPGQGPGFGYPGPKGMAVIGPAMESLGMEHEQSTG